MKWGKLRLRTLAFNLRGGAQPSKDPEVSVSGRLVPAKYGVLEGRVDIELAADLVLLAGQSVEIVMS